MIWYEILICIWIITHVTTLVTSALLGWSFYIPNPGKIYKSVPVNKFGAIFVYSLYLVFCPLFVLCSLVFWLCTVGRKD